MKESCLEFNKLQQPNKDISTFTKQICIVSKHVKVKPAPQVPYLHTMKQVVFNVVQWI